MDYSNEYTNKLVTADEAAAVVKSGDWVDYCWAVSTPVAVDAALAKRLPELYDVNFRGGILMHEPEIFKLEDAAEHMTWNSWHMNGIERKAISRGFSFLTPMRYSELPRYYRDSADPLNVAIVQTTPMNEKGFFGFGPTGSHMKEICQKADILIVEVNKNVPSCFGSASNQIHISHVDMIVEGDNQPIDAMTDSEEATEVDKTVAEIVVSQIPDGACLQLGIGGMPNAIGKMIAESDLKDLGVHTEMYVDAFVDMAEAGKITGNRKELDPGLQVYAFAVGTKKMYDYLDNNPECYCTSVEYINRVRSVSSLSNFVSINNAIDIDLFGQVNAESVGTRNISGAGGQMDFVMGAYGSEGGKSFICLSSTFKNNKTGEFESRIRPTLRNGSIVTDTRATAMYVVTEYGMLNLKGLSAWQRAEGLIGISHPDFRDQLISEAEKMHIWRASNKR